MWKLWIKSSRFPHRNIFLQQILVVRNKFLQAQGRKKNSYGYYGMIEFVKVIPPLMRMGSKVQRDPNDDCLTQIAKLQYTYYDNHNTDESESHENTLTVSRHTRIWAATSNDESLKQNGFLNSYLKKKNWRLGFLI